MALNAKANNQINAVALLADLPPFAVEGAVAKVRFNLNDSAGDNDPFMDMIINTSASDTVGYYILSFYGPKATKKLQFGYRNFSNVYAPIWSI